MTDHCYLPLSFHALSKPNGGQLTQHHPFHFLTLCFSYPEQDTLSQSAQTLCLLAADVGFIEGAVLDSFNATLPEIQAEYVRLFINAPGGTSAPPYASVYIDNAGILCQQGYNEALHFYAQAGLEPGETGESPDHIAHELAFLAHLLDSGQEGLAEKFIKDHLRRWYPIFLKQLLTADPHPFFSVLGQVTDLCLNHTMKEVVHDE